jgi:hypothetical protein
MQPDFEKANEIYFRLGIIYKQQQKYNQSLEVKFLAWVSCCMPLKVTVLQIHSHQPAETANGRRYMVSNWSCP